MEKMATASELFEPLVKQLNDQVLFLGRMLTPDGIEALQDEAAALNEAVTAAIEQAREILGEAQNVKPDDGSVPHPDGA